MQSDPWEGYGLVEAIIPKGQMSALSSPISDPRAELRLSLPSQPSSEARRAQGVLRTYGDNSAARLRLDTEPAAAISRSGSLSNGTSATPKVLVPELARLFTGSTFLVHFCAFASLDMSCLSQVKADCFFVVKLYTLMNVRKMANTSILAWQT